jgi:hypothetical protein
MFNSKIYAILALALVFAGAAPAQAGWNGWQWMSINEKTHQHSTIAPAAGDRAFAYVRDWGRYRRLPKARIGTPSPTQRPVMTGHTSHHPGH